jgi:choline kinase
MQAVILAAGVGSRLDGAEGGLPKGLLEVGGASLLDRQVEQLRALGVERICIVTGYRPELVERRFAGRAEFRHNPFFDRSNNLVSLVLARDWIEEDVVVAYADLLYEPSVLEAALAAQGDINLLVDRSAVAPGHALVRMAGHAVQAIGRHIPVERADARFVGLTRLTLRGLGRLRPELERAMRAAHVDQYYTVALTALAERGHPIEAVDVTGQRWCEIDLPVDLDRARRTWS